MALPSRGGVFRAASYDELVDSPFECGTHRTFDFRVKGVSAHPRRSGGAATRTPRASCKDLKKLVARGGRPLRRPPVRALSLPRPPRRRARAAASSTAPRSPSRSTRGPSSPRRRTAARSCSSRTSSSTPGTSSASGPRRFGPFDYTREVHTKDLWALEGVTSYYEVLLAVRGRPPDARAGLRGVDDVVSGHLETPGREVQSAEMASFDTWIRFYRPDENSVNVAESYYRRGQLLGLALDLTIRGATAGRRGLDDVMRLLWRAVRVEGKRLSGGRRRGRGLARHRLARGGAPVLRPLRARAPRRPTFAGSPHGRGPRAAARPGVRGRRHGRRSREDARATSVGRSKDRERPPRRCPRSSRAAPPQRGGVSPETRSWP